MLPTGAGEPRVVTHDKITHRNARWFPDGRRILFQGNAPGEASRIWVQDVAGGAPRPVTPQNVAGTQVTPDGRTTVYSYTRMLCDLFVLDRARKH